MKSRKSSFSHRSMSLKGLSTPKHCKADVILWARILQFWQVVMTTVTLSSVSIISRWWIELHSSCYKVIYQEHVLGCIWLPSEVCWIILPQKFSQVQLKPSVPSLCQHSGLIKMNEEATICDTVLPLVWTQMPFSALTINNRTLVTRLYFCSSLQLATGRSLTTVIAAAVCTTSYWLAAGLREFFLFNFVMMTFGFALTLFFVTIPDQFIFQKCPCTCTDT